MKAIILAGGFGTRLREVISDVPKPMADINGQPFLEILISYLYKNGISEFIISLHHLGDKIEKYFTQTKFKEFNISFVTEPEALGTGGAIKYVLEQSKLSLDEDVLILNGDSFVHLDLTKFINSHRSASLSIVLRKVKDTSRYGKVLVEDNYIKDFSSCGDKTPGMINGGIYLLKPEIFKFYNLPKIFSFEKDFLEKYIKQLRPFYFLSEDYFIDIGIPKDYKRACSELQKIVN